MPPETLGAWLEGRLAAGDAAGVEAHLTGCVRCRWVVAQTVALRERPPDGE